VTLQTGPQTSQTLGTPICTGLDAYGHQWQIDLQALPPGVTLDMIKPGQVWYVERRTTFNRLFLYVGQISVSTIQGVTVSGIPTPGTALIATSTSGASWVTISGGSTNGDFIPNSDNTYTLGSPGYRWKSLYVGSGTIYITDASLGTQAALTVNGGVFNINGVVQAQLPQIVTSGITTNTLVASGYVTTSGLNANSITFSDGTTQISANNTRYRTVTVTGSSTVVLDMSKDNTVLVNINQGTLNITLSGLTANRTTDLLVKYGTTGGAQVNTGVSTGSNSSNNNSFYLPSHPFSSYKYYCVDGTLSNTFVVGTIS